MDSLLEILLDDDNVDPITLSDENGRIITFEQVAVIPYCKKKARRLYTILKPVNVEGIKDDEAVVFRVNQNKQGGIYLVVEENEKIAVQVFNKYYDLLERDIIKGRRK